MEKLTPLTIVALVLSCIRICFIIASSVGMLLYSGSFQNPLLSNMIYYANMVLHFSVLMFLALFLNFIKESVWYSVAFVISAVMSIVFVLMSILKITSPQVWGAISGINFLVVIFFIVQSFMVKNTYFKVAFLLYGLLTVFITLMNVGIPYLAYYLSMPMSFMQFTSVVYVLPAIFETYLIYLFYQYFSNPALNQHNNSESYL